jgi:hypothetical protein
MHSGNYHPAAYHSFSDEETNGSAYTEANNETNREASCSSHTEANNEANNEANEEACGTT